MIGRVASRVMNDTPAPPTDMEARWRRWAAPARAWGPPGNERLTSSVGLVLLVLLGIETLTTLALHSYLPEHIFLGLLLIPPVVLKLASTGWRFFRFYTNSEPYRLEGPPRLLLRVLAPLLVVSTLTLFGSGVAFIIVGHGGGPLLQLHAVSFAVWGVLIAIHILAYLTRLLRVGLADWRHHAATGVAGDRSRRAALLGALLAGVILALATYTAQDSWLDHRHEHRHGDGAAHAAAATGDGAEAAIRRPTRISSRSGSW
jgi:hypothetical protein